MNTFATLLLAFPFYLAVNGRLIAYTSLVNSQKNTGDATASNVTVKPIAQLA